ncbi:MAG: GNAT family N-acetyltransferase [Flammeovirgaceae bacterium]
MLTSKKVFQSDAENWALVRDIREKVFVIEQQVPLEEEYDEFDETATHFLVLLDGKPVGTCRWRFTAKGIKLERYAVLAEARGNGVGGKLVELTLADIAEQPAATGKKMYLHAQVTAVFLYEKFGFQKEGDQFDECGIMHYKMVKQNSR